MELGASFGCYLYAINGSIVEVGISRSLGNLLCSDRDMARCCRRLFYLLDARIKIDICSYFIFIEQGVGILRSEEVDIAYHRTLNATWLHITQYLAILHNNLYRNAWYLLQINLTITASHRLGCSISHTVDTEGEDARGVGRNGYRALREGEVGNLKLHILLGRDSLQALVVINEDKATITLRTIRPTEMTIIALLDILRAREGWVHRSKCLGIIVHHKVELTKQEIMVVWLSELTKWSLEIVGLHRHIVIIGSLGALVFIKRSQALRVCATMIHIVSKQVATTSEFHYSHRVGILRIYEWSTMIGCSHTATKFTSEIRIIVVALSGFSLLSAELVGSDGCRTAEGFEVESFIIGTSPLLDATLPEAVGIVAKQRKHLAKRYRASECGPACASIER